MSRKKDKDISSKAAKKKKVGCQKEESVGAAQADGGGKVMVSQVNQQAVVQQKSAREYLDKLFQGCLRSEREPLRPPSCLISDVLRQRGASQSAISILHIVHAGLNSAALGSPISIGMVTENGVPVTEAIDLAIQMSTPGNCLEFTKLQPDLIFRGAQQLKGKTLIGYNDLAFRGVSNHLDILIEKESLNTHVRAPSYSSSGIEKVQAEGPVAILLVTQDPRHPLLQNQKVLVLSIDEPLDLGRVPLGTEAAPGSDVLAVDLARVRRVFQRVQPAPVKIPFLEQLSKSVPPRIFCILERLIENYTRINHPLPPTQEEVWSALLDVDQGKVRSWMIQNGFPPDVQILKSEDARNHRLGITLQATKVEYYLSCLLLKNQFVEAVPQILPRQCRVFNKLVEICLGRMGASFVDVSDETQTIKALHDKADAGAGRGMIYEHVNKDGRDPISWSTLNGDLQALVRANLVERKKPKRSQQYLYAVTRLRLQENIDLPPAKDIIDPIYEGRPVNVVNPLTGEVETI